MTTVLAFDPDLTSTAWCVGKDSQITQAGVIKVPPDRTKMTLRTKQIQQAQRMALAIQGFLKKASEGIFTIVVEGQRIYQKSKASPNDLLLLAFVAGACTAPNKKLLRPDPSDWKGDVPKGIHQARVFKRLDMAYKTAGGQSPYCVPQPHPWWCAGYNDGDWKHITDAVGLCLWGMEQ